MNAVALTDTEKARYEEIQGRALEDQVRQDIEASEQRTYAEWFRDAGPVKQKAIYEANQ